MSKNRCLQCGKLLDPAKQWPFSIVLGGNVCLDCLPPDAREAWDGLCRSMEKLREMAKPMVERLRETAIYRPVHELIVFWKKLGIVHTSLTALTHAYRGEAFSIVWADDFSQGVESHDNYARNFNQGIKYPNIRLSGLADFEHIRAVQKPAEEPNENKKFIEICECTGDGPLSHKEGNGVFARSIAEVLIVAMHVANSWGLKRNEVEPVTLETLVSLIRENKGNAIEFERVWRAEKLGAVYEDVVAAIKSDELELRRFVRCGEIFLLCLEMWV